jgi:hypothetical protein
MTASFNTYYLMKMFSRPVKETADDKMTVKGFCRTLIIRDVILITADTQKEVSNGCMSGGWHKLWPENLHDHRGFDMEENVSQSCFDIV